MSGVDAIPCPNCKGCGRVALAEHAPRAAAVLALLRELGTIGTADVVRRLDTSQANAAGLLSALCEWGFAASAPKVGRQRRWTLRVDAPPSNGDTAAQTGVHHG